MIKINNKEEFVNESKMVHGDKFDYSKVEFINISRPVIIICPFHGEFLQPPRRHCVNKSGCDKCAREGKRLSTDIFIKKSIEVHGDNKFDYSKVNYFDHKTKIIIICLLHGEFSQSPMNHLQGHGCHECNMVNRRSNNEEFINIANIIHNNKYDYSKSNYVNMHEKIEIICPNHGSFWQRVTNHLSGRGCRKCSPIISFPEEKWLNSLNISEQNRQKSIHVGSKLYKVDAFDPITNTIYEFYGDYWHGNPKVFNQDSIHPTRKISYGTLYNKTLEREDELKQAGYTIISIWEKDFIS